MAFTSDLGPHWLPDEFVAWDGYARLWQQCTTFLCQDAAAFETPGAYEPAAVPPR